MEKFKKNHPRFCAKYIQSMGIGTQESSGWCHAIQLNKKYFIHQRALNIRAPIEYSVGQKVLIAKRISQPLINKQWNVHEIKLSENYWHYEYFMDKSSKEQRTTTYEPIAKSWFGKDCYIVEEISLEYIKRKFGYK